MVYFKKTSKCLGKDKEEIIELLKKDFKEKCYLCEDKTDPRYLEIEHFLPKRPKNSPKEDEIRKNSWGNLMLACSQCNKQKSNIEPILNPTFIDEKIDEKIFFRIILDDKNQYKSKIAIGINDNKNNNIATNNTAELLVKIHNGKNLKSSGLREKIYNEVVKFEGYIKRYQCAETERRKRELLQDIKEELSNSSHFTAFKRWIVKDSPKYREFEQYIQDKEQQND